MGMIMSASHDIEGIRWTKLDRGRVHKAELVALVDRPGGATGPQRAVVKLANGQWTAVGFEHTPNGRWAVPFYGRAVEEPNVLAALVKAGAVTQAEVDAHLAQVARAMSANNRRHWAKLMREACTALGVQAPDLPDQE